MARDIAFDSGARVVVEVDDQDDDVLWLDAGEETEDGKMELTLTEAERVIAALDAAIAQLKTQKERRKKPLGDKD